MSGNNPFKNYPQPKEGFPSHDHMIDSIEYEDRTIEELLNVLDPEQAEKFRNAYAEYRKVCDEIAQEKGGKVTIDEVRSAIPDNICLGVLHPIQKLSEGVTIKPEKTSWVGDKLDSAVNHDEKA